MPNIQTLIGKRFEDILQELYPELTYIGDKLNLVPDFENTSFFAEAKVCFEQADFTVHLKQYQIEAFKKSADIKPVVYMIGFHDFPDSMKRLSDLSNSQKGKILTKEMHVSRLYLVDNNTIENIWLKRNYISKKGNIQDCTLREGHLNQIIANDEIIVSGVKYRARDYYGIPHEKYSFSPLKYDTNKNISIGHIMPINQQDIVDFFHK